MQFNRSNHRPPAVTAADEMAVAKILVVLSQISDYGQPAVQDALADARLAVAEKRNEIADPIQRNLHEMQTEPIAKAVAAILGMDVDTVAAIAFAVLIPSRAGIMLDVVRRHLADLRPNLKLSTNGKRTAGRRRA